MVESRSMVTRAGRVWLHPEAVGVKVTELFWPESDAQAIHHPNHLTRLFKSG
jgi:hypothetical protein